MNAAARGILINACARLPRPRDLARVALAAVLCTVGCDTKEPPPTPTPTPVPVPAPIPVPEATPAELPPEQAPARPIEVSQHDLPPGWRAMDPPQASDWPADPVREFRAAWVATVKNIDWPSKPGLSVTDLRKEMNAILDRAASIGLNALIFQARPSCDAFYKSDLEPWSEYLTGASGVAPSDPDYDPLREWIDGAHARGLELHAWINPFRARHFQAESPNAATHIASVRPELVREYAKYQWLDPGESAAQDHSMRVIMDLVTRYDLDGVHIDDYFYPYPDGKVQFPDDRPWEAWLTEERDAGREPLTTQAARDDWRRANINHFVERMYTQVKQAKPWVRVGISPFGIWRPGHPPGIKGFDAYAGLFADAKLWAEKGWCDYLAPQIYWRLDSKEQNHTALLEWWLGIFPAGLKRDLFVGNYTSRVPSDPAAKVGDRNAWEPEEILRQIEATRAHGAGGNIHFSMIALLDNRRQLASSLGASLYSTPAVPTEMTWSIPQPAPPIATRLRVRNLEGNWAVQALADASANAASAPWVLVWSQEPGGTWIPHRAAPAVTTLPPNTHAIVATSLDRFGRIGPRVFLSRMSDIQ